jgi:hypothetical protein
MREKEKMKETNENSTLHIRQRKKEKKNEWKDKKQSLSFLDRNLLKS